MKDKEDEVDKRENRIERFITVLLLLIYCNLKLIVLLL